MNVLHQHSLPKYGNPVFWHHHHHILLGEKALTVRCLVLLLMLIMMCWGKTGATYRCLNDMLARRPIRGPHPISLPSNTPPSTLLEHTLVVNIERCAYELEGDASLPTPLLTCQLTTRMLLSEFFHCLRVPCKLAWKAVTWGGKGTY